MSLKYDLITITLNSENTLQRTLNSVLSQTELPSRYIFIDANSEDQTLKIINDFKDSNPQINIIIKQQIGKGISQAWNQALQYTKNTIICLLNSDDWWLPETMDKVLFEFEKDASLEILSGSISYCKSPNDQNPILMNYKPTWQMPFRMCFMHPATFVKKEIYEKIGYFNENYKCSMDYDFMFRAIRAKVKIKATKNVYTKMQAGGVANSTRKLARRETRDIAIINGYFTIPWIGWLFRSLTRR